MPEAFPTHTLKVLAKKAGVERVSEEAVEELNSVLCELARRVASQAVEAAEHAKRVTVKKEDIEIVIRVSR